MRRGADSPPTSKQASPSTGRRAPRRLGPRTAGSAPRPRRQGRERVPRRPPLDADESDGANLTWAPAPSAPSPGESSSARGPPRSPTPPRPSPGRPAPCRVENVPRARTHHADAAYAPRYLVNAAGLHADDLDRLLGHDDFTVTPRRGQLIVFDTFARRPALLLPVPTVSQGVRLTDRVRQCAARADRRGPRRQTATGSTAKGSPVREMGRRTCPSCRRRSPPSTPVCAPPPSTTTTASGPPGSGTSPWAASGPPDSPRRWPSPRTSTCCPTPDSASPARDLDPVRCRTSARRSRAPTSGPI